MAQKLQREEDEIVSLLNANLSSLEQTALIREIESIANVQPMKQKFYTLKALLQSSTNLHEQSLIVKKLSRYFLNKEGLNKFFERYRKFFVYGNEAFEKRVPQGAIQDRYNTVLEELGIRPRYTL